MKTIISMIMFCIAEPEFSNSLSYRALAQIKFDLSSGLLDFKLEILKTFRQKSIHQAAVKKRDDRKRIQSGYGVAKGEHEVRKCFKDDTSKKPATVRTSLKKIFVSFLKRQTYGSAFKHTKTSGCSGPIIQEKWTIRSDNWLMILVVGVLCCLRLKEEGEERSTYRRE
jgi:hypothetical protein